MCFHRRPVPGSRARFPFNPTEFYRDSLSVRLTRGRSRHARVCIDLVDARAPFEPNQREGGGI